MVRKPFLVKKTCLFCKICLNMSEIITFVFLPHTVTPETHFKLYSNFLEAIVEPTEALAAFFGTRLGWIHFGDFADFCPILQIMPDFGSKNWIFVSSQKCKVFLCEYLGDSFSSEKVTILRCFDGNWG